MLDSSALPDLPHVVQIGRRLWETSPTGRATVMVGSGFSRNAEPKTTGAPAFPVWLDLAQRLHVELHPGEAPGVDRDRRVERAAANGGLLQLALEYDAAFGRDRLDQLLIEAVPDDDYDPGELHRLLLTLPWADLLTTNYDTLLERTRSAVHGRRYSLVHVPQDLPGAPRPRIVKLHGSFRSHRPFVFTEEDFRRYPRQSRPFVNTVRQALMETALVLVGYSGDDPNFLSWAGWVRDELAASRPPVYLCGVLDLTPAQERVLSKRGVTPVDLGPLVPNRADPARHRKALRWLLLTLLRARPPGGVAWPLPERGPTFGDDPELPAFTSGPHLVEEPVPKRAVRAGQPELGVDPAAVAAAWANNRALDPGWAVLPLYNRRSLRRFTDRWIDSPSVASLANATSGLDRLLVVYEWAWRTERALDPLAAAAGWEGGGPGIVEQTVEPLSPGALSAADLDRWTFLALTLVRHYRRHGIDEGFDRWTDAVRAIGALRTDWAAELCYETAQRCLGRLDVEGAKAQLDAWPPGLLDPLWEIRRAAVLAETGQVEAAFALASETIARVRTEGEGIATRFSARSREGLAMFLADLTEPRTEGFFEIRGADTRWDELNGVRCNPRAEFEQLGQIVEGDPPGLRTEKTVEVDALGNERITYHDERTLAPDALRPASDLLSLFEAGLPFWCGVRVSPVVRAAHWIADPWPHWAIASLVRMLDHKTLADALDRGRVASLHDGYADALVTHALGVLGLAPGRLDQRGGGLFETPTRHQSEVKTAMVVLGRFAFRLSDEQRRQAIQHALSALRSLWSQRGHVLTRQDFSDLFHGLFDAVHDEEWATLLPAVLATPLSDGPHEAVDPVRFVSARVLRGERPENATSAISGAISAVEAGGGERDGGLLRLLRLLEADVLTGDEQGRLAEALWRTKDEETGLPQLGQFYPWVVLLFPEPEPDASVAALRRALTGWTPGSSPVRTFGTSTAEKYFQSWASSVADRPPPTTPSPFRTVIWTPSEALILLKQVEAWWRGTTKADLRDSFYSGATRSTGQVAAEALRAVAFPALLDAAALRRASRILWQMLEADIPVRFALPETLPGQPSNSRRVEAAIRKGFASSEPEDIADAAHAVFRWATLSDGSDLPDGLADELIATATRAGAGGEEAMDWLTEWVRRAPDTFPTRLMDTIAVGLQVILDSTTIPTAEERLRARSVSARRSLLRRPDLRAAGARLARALDETFKADLGPENAEVIERWRAETSSDPFPPVRRAWKVPTPDIEV